MNIDIDFIESVREMASYIAASEYEDFLENPSRIHVFYHAIVVLEGKEAAEKELERAMIVGENAHTCLTEK